MRKKGYEIRKEKEGKKKKKGGRKEEEVLGRDAKVSALFSCGTVLRRGGYRDREPGLHSARRSDRARSCLSAGSARNGDHWQPI